jgi:hypothetical protein
MKMEEEFEDTKGVIRICKLKDTQHNGQKKKDKQRSTKPGFTTYSKNRATWLLSQVKWEKIWETSEKLSKF